MTHSGKYRAARLACALSIFSALAGSTAPSPLYPIYLERLGLDYTMVTALFAIYSLGALGSLLALPVIPAVISDRRLVLAGGLILTTAGLVLFSMAHAITPLLVGRFLSGIGTGAISVVASAMLYELAPPDQRKWSATVATLAFTAGGTGGPLLTAAALATDTSPTTAPFWFIAGMCVAALIILVTARWPARSVSAQTVEPARAGHSSPGQSSRALFRLACLAVGVAWMLGAFLLALGADLAHVLFGFTFVGVAGIILTVFQLFAGIGQVLGGRIGNLRTIGFGLLGIAVSQIVLVLSVPGAHQVALLAMTPFCGLFFGVVFVGALGLANAASVPEKRSTDISRFYIAGYLSNMLPVLAMGYFIDIVGLELAFYSFSALLVALSLIGAGIALSHRSAART